MNAPILGGAAALVVGCLWLVRGRRPPLLRSTDAGAIAALNRAQIAAVQQQPAAPAPSAPAPAADALAAWRPPARTDRSGQRQLLGQLTAALAADPSSRLLALQRARRWGHPATLPLLRRGLRDSDPAVVREAALAIQRFRGCPRAGGQGLAQPVAPPLPCNLPRNVARTR